MILAGDIGGTNCRLAIFASERTGLRLLWRETYPSRERPGLVEILQSMRGETDLPIRAATFGIAGPVEKGRVQATNLHWSVESDAIARELGLSSIGLLNDLEASAIGLQELGPDDFATLQAGERDERGNRALVSAGTGLGEAGLFFDGVRHRAIPSEGGHATFAPTSELEVRLWRFLAARHGHVSWERVVSGPGLFAIYEFLRDVEHMAEPTWLAERIANADPSVEVSRAGLEGESELARRALLLFSRLYGAEASNVAVKFLARGGVFLGGGIPPKVLPVLASGAFLEGFLYKGRMQKLLERIPVKVVLHEDTALLGAARHAACVLEGEERRG